MSEEKRLRRVFNKRIKGYTNDRVKGIANVYCSPIYDLVNTAARFDLLQQVLEMFLGYSRQATKHNGQRLYGKKDGNSMICIGEVLL